MQTTLRMHNIKMKIYGVFTEVDRSEAVISSEQCRHISGRKRQFNNDSPQVSPGNFLFILVQNLHYIEYRQLKINQKSKTIRKSNHRFWLPLYPGTGTPLASRGGFNEWPNPIHVDVMGCPVSVCHQ